ncbi:MAG: hypothetical protein AB8B93_10125 [Pseudomonadales bacterium]
MIGTFRKHLLVQRGLGLSALVAGLSVAPSVSALELAAATELGARYNTNARRSTTSEDADVRYSPAFTLDAIHDGNGISMAANYRLERRLFQEDFFDDQDRLTGYANINWAPLVDRFDVRVTQNRAETTRQSFGRGAQDDRQIISSTEAAPRLRFQVRDSDELQLLYTYTDTHSDDEDIDNQRQSATARYRYGISQDFNLTLSATRGETEYEFEGVPKIDFTTYQATIDYERGRNLVTITGGESTFEREGQPDTKGPIWNVRWRSDISANSAFSAGVSRAITDRSQELLDVDSRDYEELGFTNSDLTDIFQSDIAYLEFSRSFGATNGRIRLEQAESDFERVPRDEKSQSATISATRLIRRELEGRLSLSYNKVTYRQLPTDFDQLRLEASALWDVNRRFETEGGVFMMKRNGRGAAGDFDDFGFFLIARYFFAGQNGLTDDRQTGGLR